MGRAPPPTGAEKLHVGCGNGGVHRLLQPPAGGVFLFRPRGTGKSPLLAQLFPDALSFQPLYQVK